MKRLARTTTVYGAAVIASGIAVATALEAWVRLQQPTAPASILSSLASEVLLAIALPLLTVVLVIGLRRGTRPRGSATTSDPPPGPIHDAARPRPTASVLRSE